MFTDFNRWSAHYAGGDVRSPARGGVRFEQEPETTAWGTQAIIADPDGNTFVIVAV